MRAIIIPDVEKLEQIKSINISVTSPESELTARAYLTDVRLAGKKLDDDIKKLKAPYQAEIRRIDDAAREWKATLASRDQALECALLEYRRKVKAEVDKANSKTLEKYEGKVANTEAKAIAAGKPIPVVLPPQLVATPQKSVEVEGSKQTIVKRKAWRLGAPLAQYDKDTLTAETVRLEAAAIPLEYFILDTSRIGKVVRAGGSIPGIEVFEEESIAVRS